ncbi:MAG: tetratricopeptide repeat protein [Rubrivivax sp.]
MPPHDRRPHPRRRLPAALCAIALAFTPLWVWPAAAEPPDAAATAALTEAIGQYGRGEVDAARRSFEALAARGLPAADYNLAVMHLAGDLPGGAEAALPHLQRAADRGFVTALFGLGQVYEQGRLGRSDPTTAHGWYLRAAEAGSVDGQVAVATAHYLGRGAAKDMVQAAHWYREAAKGGDIGAQYLLASMYEAGDGVARDLRLARYWYDVAAKNGDEAAPDKLREIDARLRDAPG